jgi:hypothetical protein
MWLNHQLDRLARKIEKFREGETRPPLRSDFRPRLAALAKAARIIKHSIGDPALCNFLGYKWQGPDLNEVTLSAAMDSLALHADMASGRLAGRGGSPFAFPDGGISAQQLCAWAIKHVMGKARPTDDGEDALIGVDNARAHEAANLLWQAAGGTALGSKDGTRPPTGWREYFIAISDIERSGNDVAKALRSMESELLTIPPPLPLEGAG